MVPVKKVNKRAMNQKEKELKQITKCLRQKLTWCNRTGQSYNSTIEQYSLYPRAISDEEGCPLKGAKSVWKDKLGRRYQGPDVQVVMGSLSKQWKADTVILDGMFFLNCKPLRNVTSIKDYSNVLFNRFVLPHYQSHVIEVHLLFDSPENNEKFNPKVFEQKRRDKGKEASSHTHIVFTPSTSTPSPWKSYIDCRECKASIVQALGLSFIQIIRMKLVHGQTLYLSGCFPQNGTTYTYKFSGNSLPVSMTRYSSNSRESDMRIWRHAFQTEGSKVLIYSHDTDVYNIGLSLLSSIPNKHVIVQLNVPHSPICSYLHLSNLINAIELDPDLASLPRNSLSKIFQILIICSGCNYTSNRKIIY